MVPENSTRTIGQSAHIRGSGTDEHAPLLFSRPHPVDRKRRCPSLPVEVILVPYYLAAMSLVSVEQLYVYSRVRDDNDYDSYDNSVRMDNEAINRTDLENVSRCGSPSRNITNDKSQGDIQAKAARWLLFLTLSEYLCAMVATYFASGIIDNKGRKPALIFPAIGSLSKIIVFMAVIWFKLPIAVLLVGDIMEGSSGYYGTVLAGALAYIADMTPTTQARSTRITVALALNGIGIGLTFLLTGFLIDRFGFLYPLVFSLIILTTTLLLTIFTVRETLTVTCNLNNKSKTAFCVRKLFWTFSVYTSKSRPRGRWMLVLLAAAFFAFNLVITGRGSVESLYQLDFPFCWSATKIGYFQAARAMGHQIVTLFFFPPLRRFLTELPIAILGAITSVVACLLEAFANNDLSLYMVTVVEAFQMMVPPTIKSLMSSQVDAHEQGAVFASLGVLQMVCTCVAQVLFTAVYAATVSVFPGAVFLSMATCFLASFILLVLIHFGRHWNMTGAVHRTVHRIPAK